jgi:hypothetical protein
MTITIPSNAPAVPRSYGLLARWIRHWLGVADQRKDFNALATTLTVKDAETAGLFAGQRTESEAHAELIQRILTALTATRQQLAQTTSGLLNVNDRLSWHEKRVSLLTRSKQGYDQALQREKARREQMVTDNPQWSDDVKQHVRVTGRVPEPENGTAPVGEPAPDTAA